MSRIQRTTAPELLLFALASALLLLVTGLAYWPGLSGPFLLDDLANLQTLGENGGVSDLSAALNFIFGNRSGPLGRPVSMASFLMNAQDWPAPAEWFKFTNLMLHLLSGILVLWLSLLLFRLLEVSERRARMLALLVSGLWLLHPLNVSTTLYVVQRMTQLVTLFSLAGLICWVKGRVQVRASPIRSLVLMSLCLFPFGLLAVLSKENGVLLLIAIVVMELTVFASTERTKLYKIWLASAVCLPLLAVAVAIAVQFSGLTAGYQYREFGLLERLLTEARVLVDYLVKLILPGIGDLTLHHDDFPVSRSLLEPLNTLPALLILLAGTGLAWYLRRVHPVFSFGVFWFLGWHLLESTFLPLELYFEHRNYLPMIGPLFSAVYYLGNLIDRLQAPVRFRILPAVGCTVILLLGFLTYQLSQLWGNGFALQAHWAAQHPGSYRAQAEYGFLLADFDEPELGYPYIAGIQERFPREVALNLQRWNFACTYGLPLPYPVQNITQVQDLDYYRADLTGEIRVFLENLIAARCQYPSQGEVLALMERLSTIPMRNFEHSGFHLLYSDLYLYFQQLNPALIELRKAFDLRPVPAIPIRQAIISASAGNYQDSLVFLQRAREADQQRGWFEPSRQEEIASMERDLRARLSTN